MMIFMSKQGSSILKSSAYWSADGTFAKVEFNSIFNPENGICILFRLLLHFIRYMLFLPL